MCNNSMWHFYMVGYLKYYKVIILQRVYAWRPVPI